MKPILYIFIAVFSSLTYLKAQPEIGETEGKAFLSKTIDSEFNPDIGSGPNLPDPDDPIENKRIVYWTHGLKGTSDSWSVANNFSYAGLDDNTDEFKGWDFIPDLSIDYTTPGHDKDIESAALYISNSIEHISNSFKDQIEDFPNDVQHNIIIAHSMGVIASRKMDILYDQGLIGDYGVKPFGGIVSFAGEHKGVVLAKKFTDHIDNPTKEISTVESFLLNGCECLLDGPVEELKEPVKFFTNLGEYFGVLNFEDEDENAITFDEKLNAKELCEKLKGKTGFLLSPMLGTDKLLQDFSPDSEIITELNADGQHANLHAYVSFYGEETDNDDLMFRFFSSSTKPVTEYDYWDSDRDEETMDSVNVKVEHYRDNYKEWDDKSKKLKKLSDKVLIAYIVNPLNLNLLALHYVLNNKYENANRVKKAHKRGYNWWLEVNEEYRELCELYETQLTYNALKCVVRNQLGQVYSYWPISDPEECVCTQEFEELEPGSCTEFLFSVEPAIQVEKVLTKSDGLVKASSASAWNSEGILPQKMEGSNHYQMRNDQNTPEALKRIFDGVVDGYFETDPKK